MHNYFVIGNPIEHSLSPLVHNYWFKKYKINSKYEKKKLEENDLNNFIIRIQLCLDAKLAEVISYQGEKPIPYFMGISKTQSKDEKIQQNRFLTEWLESIFCSGN